MIRRNLICVLASFLLVCLALSEAGPAFKLKHYNSFKLQRPISDFRTERQLSSRNSPIHFINLKHSHPSKKMFSNPFFAPRAPADPLKPSPIFQVKASKKESDIYHLPIKMQVNGKPQTVTHGFPKKKYSNLKDSKVIRLPLLYKSNAKPMGIYLLNQKPADIRRLIKSGKL